MPIIQNQDKKTNVLFTEYIVIENHPCNTRLQSEDIAAWMQNWCFQDFFIYLRHSEWSILDARKFQNLVSFRNCIFKIGRSSPNPCYNTFNPMDLKLLARLRLGLSHLNKHKFDRKFANCFDPKCSCSLSNEDTVHFSALRFLYWLKKARFKWNIFSWRIHHTFFWYKLVEVLLYGKRSVSSMKNSKTLNSLIVYILKS